MKSQRMVLNTLATHWSRTQ